MIGKTDEICYTRVSVKFNFGINLFCQYTDKLEA
mgnify:CR=1 FL=1